MIIINLHYRLLKSRVYRFHLCSLVLFFGFVLVSMFFVPTPILSVSDDVSSKSINRIPDLAIISGKKFSLVVNNEDYSIYYGIILGNSTNQDYNAVITAMSVIPEKKSLLINFDNIFQTDNVWIRFPNEVISANNEKFVLLVDGIEKGYELSSHGNDTRLGFVIKTGTQQVEIIGNNVVPEFPVNIFLVFLMVFCVVIVLTRNCMKLGKSI